MKLNEIRDNPAARTRRTRVGRGEASGKGKTAGRGDKGQKSRSGVALKGFEGGQMPIHMRLPKRGFNKPNRRKLNAVNLGRLQQALDEGRLDDKATISAPLLREAGIIRRELDGVRILGNGALKTKLDFEVIGMSKSAMAAVEKLGGKITILAPSPGDEDAEAAKKAKKAEKAKAKKAKKAADEAADEAASDKTADDKADASAKAEAQEAPAEKAQAEKADAKPDDADKDADKTD